MVVILPELRYRFAPMVSSDSRRIATADGQELAARFFRPAAEPLGAVLVVPAMGVGQSYYEAFAAWLASQGLLAVTFDYRGTGQSRHVALREVNVDILGWARFDCGAMLEAAVAHAPGKPVYWIGHSLGGQILPFVPNRDRLTKAVTIATGSGYWRENSASLRWRAWFLWYVVAPLLLPLFGYFPGRRLGMVGDLPRGVMEQWRRWCLNPEYAVGVEGPHVRAEYAGVGTPIVSLSFTDDEFMSARNTLSLHSFYTGAPKLIKRIAPGDLGVRRIGHFGFFRSRFQQSLWEQHLLPELS